MEAEEVEVQFNWLLYIIPALDYIFTVTLYFIIKFIDPVLEGVGSRFSWSVRFFKECSPESLKATSNYNFSEWVRIQFKYNTYIEYINISNECNSV